MKEPTQEKLSELAATIAAGMRCKPREAVREAIEIWEAAGEELEAKEAKRERRAERAEAREALTEKLPEGDGPLPFAKFLLLFVDGGKPATRFNHFSAYLRDQIPHWRRLERE